MEKEKLPENPLPYDPSKWPRFAFVTLKYKDGEFSVVPERANLNVEKNGIEYDKKDKLIKLTLKEQPACFPTAICSKNAKTVEAIRAKEVFLRLTGPVKEGEVVEFIGVYY